MVHFNNLRLGGFKSFVEPTDLRIDTGMTGIVGPNGCGKSNLVEALRWVMGESSAKRMRGGEMDDVIFAGTAARPARNLADVALVLDNRDRSAPGQFNDHDELEIVRRITRGQGSNYRVNGKEVRAKDVQLLFADLASGAQSTAMVSQGRVGAIINAKAKDRRGLLEEAAGITGLHTRRHETELRLRAAETNLERLDDVIATMEAQLQALKKQARQANRYRNINVQIRRLEAILLHLEAEDGKTGQARAIELFGTAEQAVALLTETSAAAAREQAEAAAALPDLRQNEAEAAAGLQRLLLDRESLDREIERAKQARAAAEDRLRQLEADRGRGEKNQEDAGRALLRLDEEQETLAAAEAGFETLRGELEAGRDEASEAVETLEEALRALSEKVAADESRSRSLAEAIGQLENRLDKLRNQRDALNGQRRELETQSGEESALEAASALLAEQEAALQTSRQTLQEARDELAAHRLAAEESEVLLRAQQDSAGKLRAEASALTKLLDVGNPDIWRPLIDAVKVTGGYETALGAALGDDLAASDDEAAPVHWETLPSLDPTPALPSGAEPLSKKVEGPKALQRRLSQIGLVADDAMGHRLQTALLPGQRLVTKEGALWRWDGFAAKADAPTAAAVRLTQRNRLEELEAELAEAEKDVATWQSDHQAKADAASQAAQAESQARAALDGLFAQIDQARKDHGALAQQMAAVRSRLGVIIENEARLGGEQAEAEERLEAARQERETLPDLAAARETIAGERAALSEARSTLTEVRGRLDRLLGEAKTRRDRLASINDERGSWNSLVAGAKQQLEELAAREAKLRAEIDELARLPEQLSGKREALVEQVETASATRQSAGDLLVAGESRQGEADKALRAAEQNLASAREERVRAEAAREQADERLKQTAEKVSEKLGCRIDEVLSVAEIDADKGLPPRPEVETKLERLHRERDNIGPVNLRAEAESEELDQQIVGLQDERGDLVSAIAKLRQGIGRLNREGRVRLLEAFEKVNAHFTELFVRLFGGGRAYLQLTDAEDPLDAGLEIMASPPGKRLQIMSLLSGGEQALTALALLFAAFLTNPAPICVLDEVDAPLDDANVDRLCALVDELCHSTATRFIVITHHRMTMARVDRLYGVTMSERGVSQLVSVDLDTAERLRETA